MVGVSTGTYGPAECVGLGDKSSCSQWLAVTGDRKGGRAWADVGPEGLDSPRTVSDHPLGGPSMLLGYHLCGIGEVGDCFLRAHTA